MKLSGSHLFQAPRQRVFAALLDPSLLKASIPGCEGAWYSADRSHMKVRLLLPLLLPGLQGPYDVTIVVKERQEPDTLVLQAGRNGKIGGSVTTITHMTFAESETEPRHTVLNYEAQGDFTGPISIADNPMFRDMIRHYLDTFLKNLNSKLQVASAL